MSDSEGRNFSLPSKLTKLSLGELLVNSEFIAPRDLECALEDQIRTNELLGEILVRMGLIDSVDLQVVLDIQKELVSFEKAATFAAGMRQLLGELLIQARRITSEQLERALHEQRKTGEKLGEVLVRLKLLSEQELDGVLVFQHSQTDPQRAVRLRLGQLLVATDQITQEQLQNALQKQQLYPYKKIGELLVEAGYITPDQVSHGLKLQHRLVTAVLIAILSLSSPLSPTTKHDEAISSSMQTTTYETAEAHATLKVLYQVPELVITHADILRGYVQVKSASHIEIRSNVFFFLSFSGFGKPFRKVHVQGFGRNVLISTKGRSLFLSELRGLATFELSYKFFLSRDARPGTYAWPLKISAHPIMMALRYY
jgi:hypothetical protein